VTQQLTQQELAAGAARWACRTWVSGSHGLPRSWYHGELIRGLLYKLLDHGIMGCNCPLLAGK